MNSFYIYKHLSLEGDEVLYIGKGKGDRAYCKSGRSKVWNKLVKAPGYRVEIEDSNLSQYKAFQKEKELILKYKELGQCRANIMIGQASDEVVAHIQETKKINKIKQLDKFESSILCGLVNKLVSPLHHIVLSFNAIGTIEEKAKIKELCNVFNELRTLLRKRHE